MAYLKCFGVGVLMALAGIFAWIIYVFVSASLSVPPELRRAGGAATMDLRSLFNSRALMVVLIFFVLGFFIEFLIVKRGLLRPR